MDNECVLKGGKMSCQLEDRLQALEGKVGTIHEVLIELKTMVQSPHPIRDEISSLKEVVHGIELNMARQETADSQLTEKIKSAATSIFETRSKETISRIVAIATFLSLLGGLLGSWINIQFELRADKVVSQSVGTNTQK